MPNPIDHKWSLAPAKGGLDELKTLVTGSPYLSNKCNLAFPAEPSKPEYSSAASIKTESPVNLSRMSKNIGFIRGLEPLTIDDKSEGIISSTKLKSEALNPTK